MIVTLGRCHGRRDHFVIIFINIIIVNFLLLLQKNNMLNPKP